MYASLTPSFLVFIIEGLEDLINLQREGQMAKPYQVRQVQAVIAKYGLEQEGDK